MNFNNSHRKAILTSTISDFEIIKSLKRLPTLSFSEKGLENLCKRYGITMSHLQRLISESLKSQG
jgi:hypothetical protein